MTVSLKPGHIPWAVDPRIAESLYYVTQTIQDDQTSSLGCRGSAITGGEAPDDHPPSAKNSQRRSQPYASGTRAGQSVGVDFREQTDGAVRSHVNNGRAGALQIWQGGSVSVKVANKNVVFLKTAYTFANTHYAVWVDVSI